jgi:hypothetical protein
MIENLESEVERLKAAQPVPVQEPVGEVNRYGLDSHGRKWHGIHWYDPNVDVAHGTKLYTAAQPAPVKVWEAEGYDALMQEMQMVKARNIRQHAEIERLKAAQPAVPDAFGTREGEHPQYIQGWNDCRAETLKMRKP